MKKAVILCAGAGTKIWPYAEIRCKAMINVSNKPIVAYSVDALTELGFEQIVIVGNRFVEEIRAYFKNYKNVEIVIDNAPKGTAFSLLAASESIGENDFLSLYGDTIVDKNDLDKLIKTFKQTKENTALVGKLVGHSSDVIGCDLSADGSIHKVWGHSRDESTHIFGGFAFKANMFDNLKNNSCRFTATEVGMMPPIEGYIEMTVSDYIDEGGTVKTAVAQSKVLDIDKPWHILEASHYINGKRCNELKSNELDEGASIDESATINGFVKLGKNSKIGKNVIIEGNIIVGDNTDVSNAAIIEGNVVIGDNSSVKNACFVSYASTIGNDCVISHAAELDGIIFNRVFLYHYMEYYGIIGENTDLGAATVCGSLRFDDGHTIQRIKGRRELPNSGYGDAVFLGDYCRTGVNAILMPGVKVGVYSVVGAGVLLNKDLKNNTLLYTEQNQIEKTWGFEKYGW